MFRFEIPNKAVKLKVGKDEENYWSVFPSIDVYPVIIVIKKPHDQFSQKIRYWISLIKLLNHNNV
ncbi:MAG TPA: hypothetical protein VGD14_00295 [bacterium]